MSERAAFISAILDNFDDDTPRLVFADWLQENGDEARAEFIRTQIEAAKLPKAQRDSSESGKRAAQLLKEHEAEWRGAVGSERWGVYERGFLNGLSIDTNKATEFAERVLSLEPAGFCLLLLVHYEDDSLVTPSAVDTLAAQPVLRAVRFITNQSSSFGPERFARLMRSPHLVNLRSILLFEDPIGAEGVRAVAESPSPFVLESLDLIGSLRRDNEHESPDTLAAVKLLATHSRFAVLKSLGLMHNGLGDRSIERLLASKTLPRDLKLELEQNDYNEERFGEALAKRFTGGSDGG